jgi:hypothetical protein
MLPPANFSPRNRLAAVVRALVKTPQIHLVPRADQGAMTSRHLQFANLGAC